MAGGIVEGRREMIYKLGYNLPKAEINKRVMAYEANQTEIARLQAEIIQLRGKYNRLCEANSLDDVVWGKTWTEMEEQQTETARLKAKLELCRESFIECRVCSMMPGEVEKITTEALASIERRDGE
jgi:hypothetical protein